MRSKGGRPTKYKEEYCYRLIEHMEAGRSFKTFAGTIGVNRDTLYSWAKIKPDFRLAKDIAISACLYHWETIAIAAATGKVRINGSLWAWQMRNRFGPHWGKPNYKS